MPANLNALIRYKTIDICLSNRNRRWTIGDLLDACSDALREHRGSETGVSERTLRDDIRVMRSNILGFNAPIKQRNGLYYYADPSYSIFQASAVKKKLLKRILALLLELRAELNHPELEILIGKLSEIIPPDKATGVPVPGVLEELKEEKVEEELLEDNLMEYMPSADFRPSAVRGSEKRRKVSVPSLHKGKKLRYTFSWQDVFDLF